MSERNIAASVRARLLNRARETKQDFNLVLTRFAMERLLYRLSISFYAPQFLLKGALLFDLWFDVPHRLTRDADFLGCGSAEPADLDDAFKDICVIDVNDGVIFHIDTLKVIEIKKQADYPGVRITMLASIDGARCPIQLDIGFGDAVTPEPDNVDYPVMLEEFPAPRLRAYPSYTVVAEKLEALVTLGMANSRMKDYFDLWFLAHHMEFDDDILQRAIHATFNRRGTAFPVDVPFGLTDAFANDEQKQVQWNAFLKKNKLETLDFETVVIALRDFLMPVMTAASDA